MAQILCFGDSITYGMWDSQGGWVSRLRKSIDRQSKQAGYLKWHEVFNLGISGDNTESILQRVGHEIPERLQIIQDCVVVFATGLNDSVFRAKTKKYDSKPERYQKQLGQLLQLARKHTERVLFVGLTPVDEKLTQPLKVSTSLKTYHNSRVQDFDITLRKFCLSQQVPVVDTFSEFIKKDYPKLLADGIHLNDAGHALMAQLVKPAVLKLLDQMPADEPA